MERKVVVHFGTEGLDLPGALRRKSIAGVMKIAAEGALGALVIDARTADGFFRSQALLRALYDDPRRPLAPVAPDRVLALIAPGDAQAAFAFGRYGIAGVIEPAERAQLGRRLARITASAPHELPLTTPILTRWPMLPSLPILAPPRSTHLGARAEDQLPTVTIGYRHAPETLAALERYVSVMRQYATLSTVFADIATLLEVMVSEGLTCQTNLAAKAGATHTGQFIGSFAFYRELRRTRYGRIPDHPEAAIAMDVFVAVDEVLHELLHLLFLANQLRASHPVDSTLLAEELSLTWWQAVIHNRVFPEWLNDAAILEINDDFMLCEANQETRKFWHTGTVFTQYAGYPWVRYVLAHLPKRRSYIGARPDLAQVIDALATRPEAAFLLPRAAERLSIPVPFDDYPPVPRTLRVSGAS